VLQHGRTHQHHGMGLQDVDEQVAAEPVEVIQAQQDLRITGHESVELGLIANEIGSAMISVTTMSSRLRHSRTPRSSRP
jgi:hypothetical protein